MTETPDTRLIRGNGSITWTGGAAHKRAQTYSTSTGNHAHGRGNAANGGASLQIVSYATKQSTPKSDAQ